MYNCCMSYDIDLVGKKALASPLKREKFEIPNPKISFDLQTMDGGKKEEEVTFFRAKFKKEPGGYFEFDYRDEWLAIGKDGKEVKIPEGYYYTSVPYLRPLELYRHFFPFVIEVAKHLGLYIKDLQLGGEKISPEVYERVHLPRLLKRFAGSYEHAKIIERRSWALNWPAEETYFIKYLIFNNEDQSKNRRLVLARENGTVYASKVEEGKFLRDVVKRELEEVFGVKDYTVEDVFDSDQARDRFGNWLKRKSVLVGVPYIDLKKAGLQSWEWKEINFGKQ